MVTNQRIAITSPAGCWTYSQLLGASVKIKSLSVSSGLFGYDEDATYTISDIKFSLDQSGNSYAVILLDGISDKYFVWNDLEVVSLSTILYTQAICNKFCSGGSLCGYGLGSSWETETPTCIIDPEAYEDGDSLDGTDYGYTIEDGDVLG